MKVFDNIYLVGKHMHSRLLMQITFAMGQAYDRLGTCSVLHIRNRIPVFSPLD